MEDFHRRLARPGIQVAEALQAAMIARLGSLAPRDDSTLRGVGGLQAAVSSTVLHPYDWAAFQVYGLPQAR